MVLALRNRAFRTLAALYVFNCLIEWFGSIALMVLVYDATGSAIAATCMLLAKQVVPGLLIPSMGTRLDHSELRLVLGAAFAGQAIALASLAAIGYGLWLFPLAVLLGFLGAVARSSLRAGVAKVLPGDRLRGGNAVVNLAVAASAAAGPALAAAAVALAGASVALTFGAAGLGLLGVASLVLLGSTTSAVSAESSPSEQPESRAGGSPISAGWLLGLTSLVICALAMDEPALLAFSERSLDAGVAGYGAIYAAWGVGLAVGGIAFTRLLGASMLRLSAGAALVAGVGYLGMGLAPSVGVACLFALVGGAGNGVGWVAIVTAIQESAPVGHEARIATRLEAIGTAGPGIGILLGGLVAEFGGPRAALLIPGAVAFAAVAVGLLVGRQRRAYRPHHALFSPSTSGGRA